MSLISVFHETLTSGDDGMSKEPQSGVLVKESESVYTLWCTGRQYCEGMLVELKVVSFHFISDFIWRICLF